MGPHNPSFLTVAVVMAGIAGLVVGSFLNVVVYRVPLGISVSKPRSFCPDCRRQLAWWENVPLVSWLALKGRCRLCGLSISPRYPAVELATGVVFALVVWGWRATLPAVGYCCLAASMVAVLLIECSGNRAPVAVAGIGTGLSLPFFAAAAIGDDHWRTFVGPLAGSVAGLVVVAMLRRFDPTAADPRTSGRSALLVAGCWLGGMEADPIVAAVVAGAGTYAFCVVASWLLSRQHVRATAGGSGAALAGPAVPAPLAITLAVAMLAALLAHGWW